ncbi:MAG: formylglycine-generating enzyme family protein [Gallionella sp.]|nr:formylglycine-generating enzyme family protein [Gallionella sp.]
MKKLILFAAICLPLQACVREDKGQAGQVAPSIPQMVSIPGQPYEIGKYEVTQAEWLSVMGDNPSEFKHCGKTCPVERVSWNDVQEYLRKLNGQTGRQYRLPTEAEWEYACFGGARSDYCGGNTLDTLAWFSGNSGNTTHPAGQRQANGYGLYDMSGNVWEWMQDCADSSCAARALRGGSWFSYPKFLRAANRYYDAPGYRFNLTGFRLARTLP